MLDNILDLARLQSGKPQMSLRSVDLNALLGEVAEEFRIAAKSRRLAVDVPRRLPAVMGDPELLAQVLRNLLDNAFRFSREKVTIKASVAPDAESVRVSVIDDGAGIPDDSLKYLFTEFVQVNRPSKGRGYKGTGLGLAICKEIIREHRGRIWAESAVGKGSSFHFALARHVAPAAAGAATGPVADAESRIPTLA